MSNQAVYGIVNSRRKAEQLIQQLIDVGVNPQRVSILSPHSEEFADFTSSHPSTSARNWRTEERITDQSGKLSESKHRMKMGTEKHTKAPEGATTGGLTGGIIGGTLGLLAGIGALAIPGMGPFIAAGPIMGALSGLGAGGAIGGILGGLIGAGIPEYEAKRYDDRLKEGGILLSIHANSEDEAKRVKDLLQKYGAEDVSISTESHQKIKK